METSHRTLLRKAAADRGHAFEAKCVKELGKHVLSDSNLIDACPPPTFVLSGNSNYDDSGGLQLLIMGVEIATSVAGSATPGVDLPLPGTVFVANPKFHGMFYSADDDVLHDFGELVNSMWEPDVLVLRIRDDRVCEVAVCDIKATETHRCSHIVQVWLYVTQLQRLLANTSIIEGNATTPLSNRFAVSDTAYIWRPSGVDPVYLPPLAKSIDAKLKFVSQQLSYEADTEASYNLGPSCCDPSKSVSFPCRDRAKCDGRVAAYPHPARDPEACNADTTVRAAIAEHEPKAYFGARSTMLPAMGGDFPTARLVCAVLPRCPRSDAPYSWALCSTNTTYPKPKVYLGEPARNMDDVHAAEARSSMIPNSAIALVRALSELFGFENNTASIFRGQIVVASGREKEVMISMLKTVATADAGLDCGGRRICTQARHLLANFAREVDTAAVITQPSPRLCRDSALPTVVVLEHAVRELVALPAIGIYNFSDIAMFLGGIDAELAHKLDDDAEPYTLCHPESRGAGAAKKYFVNKANAIMASITKLRELATEKAFCMPAPIIQAVHKENTRPSRSEMLLYLSRANVFANQALVWRHATQMHALVAGQALPPAVGISSARCIVGRVSEVYSGGKAEIEVTYGGHYAEVDEGWFAWTADSSNFSSPALPGNVDIIDVQLNRLTITPTGNISLTHNTRIGLIKPQFNFDTYVEEQLKLGDAANSAIEDVVTAGEGVQVLTRTLIPTYNRAKVVNDIAALTRVHPILLDETQKTAITNCCVKPGGVSVIFGPPGTGKTHTTLILLLIMAQTQPYRLKVLFVARNNVAVIGAKTKFDKLKGSAKKAGLRIDIDVTFRTAYKAGKELGEDKRKLRSMDVVFVEEASLLSMWTMAPVLAWRKLTGRIILLGDFKQLPPICALEPITPEVRALCGSILDAAVPAEVRTETARNNLPDHVHMLAVNYRQCETLADVCSFGYPEAYRFSGTNPQLPWREHEAADECWAGALVSILLDPASSIPNFAQFEAKTVVNLIVGVTNFMEDSPRPGDVLIVAPHRTQRATIRRELDKKNSLLANVVVDTTERLQGSEAHMVIMCYGGLSPADIDVEAGFIFDDQRINVAASRAKSKLVIFYSSAIMKPPLSALTRPECRKGFGRFQQLLKRARRARVPTTASQTYTESSEDQ
ncbi:uncharacterized protein AMSG_02994 [Thecamonas trahens ATCC 50062]|uniref:DNA2/NAM7 helicase-like C-terminal domain-containing protein n=1 Tax=Thecamonas trahens ATCC 50062 TaxID=461836 RepID=A0A0L0D5G4_THETB|nr:hypothetical protein AMSG_02994 [Thecamonas trahens ATCC 50062]KNC46558.1 hypothetical protein AMSG_02994 [Thecamonas trahens ATCC 50062]|eukprot:XP_013760337.1 hypothetical protein AMSG_02994 [Thecamonas trahens ATCC 50062]